jgi:hypothetical protein
LGISLDKLLSYTGNKYIFSKATMKAIEKIDNVEDDQENENEKEKIVIRTLNYVLNDKIKFKYLNGKEEE